MSEEDQPDVLFRAKLHREDRTRPWGFRLQGGAEFQKPLTLLKVMEGSVACKGGLIAGDIVVRLCGRAADEMTHKEAQQAILTSGNTLEIIVERAEVTSSVVAADKTEAAVCPLNLLADSCSSAVIEQSAIDKMNEDNIARFRRESGSRQEEASHSVILMAPPYCSDVSQLSEEQRAIRELQQKQMRLQHLIQQGQQMLPTSHDTLQQQSRTCPQQVASPNQQPLPQLSQQGQKESTAQTCSMQNLEHQSQADSMQSSVTVVQPIVQPAVQQVVQPVVQPVIQSVEQAIVQPVVQIQHQPEISLEPVQKQNNADCRIKSNQDDSTRLNSDISRNSLEPPETISVHTRDKVISFVNMTDLKTEDLLKEQVLSKGNNINISNCLTEISNLKIYASICNNNINHLSESENIIKSCPLPQVDDMQNERLECDAVGKEIKKQSDESADATQQSIKQIKDDPILENHCDADENKIIPAQTRSNELLSNDENSDQSKLVDVTVVDDQVVHSAVPVVNSSMLNLNGFEDSTTEGIQICSSGVNDHGDAKKMDCEETKKEDTSTEVPQRDHNANIPLDKSIQESKPVKALVSMNLLTTSESDMSSECTDDVSSEYSDETVSVIEVPIYDRDESDAVGDLDRQSVSFRDLPEALSIHSSYDDDEQNFSNTSRRESSEIGHIYYDDPKYEEYQVNFTPSYLQATSKSSEGDEQSVNSLNSQMQTNTFSKNFNVREKPENSGTVLIEDKSSYDYSQTAPWRVTSSRPPSLNTVRLSGSDLNLSVDTSERETQNPKSKSFDNAEESVIHIPISIVNENYVKFSNNPSRQPRYHEQHNASVEQCNPSAIPIMMPNTPSVSPTQPGRKIEESNKAGYSYLQRLQTSHTAVRCTTSASTPQTLSVVMCASPPGAEAGGPSSYSPAVKFGSTVTSTAVYIAPVCIAVPLSYSSSSFPAPLHTSDNKSLAGESRFSKTNSDLWGVPLPPVREIVEDINRQPQLWCSQPPQELGTVFSSRSAGRRRCSSGYTDDEKEILINTPPVSVQIPLHARENEPIRETYLLQQPQSVAYNNIIYTDVSPKSIRRYSLPSGSLASKDGTQRRVRFADPPASSVIEIEGRRQRWPSAGEASTKEEEMLSSDTEYGSVSSLAEKLDRIELENALASAAMKMSRPFQSSTQTSKLSNLDTSGFRGVAPASVLGLTPAGRSSVKLESIPERLISIQTLSDSPSERQQFRLSANKDSTLLCSTGAGGGFLVSIGPDSQGKLSLSVQQHPGSTTCGIPSKLNFVIPASEFDNSMGNFSYSISTEGGGMVVKEPNSIKYSLPPTYEESMRAKASGEHPRSTNFDEETKPVRIVLSPRVSELRTDKSTNNNSSAVPIHPNSSDKLGRHQTSTSAPSSPVISSRVTPMFPSQLDSSSNYTQKSNVGPQNVVANSNTLSNVRSRTSLSDAGIRDASPVSNCQLSPAAIRRADRITKMQPGAGLRLTSYKPQTLPVVPGIHCPVNAPRTQLKSSDQPTSIAKEISQPPSISVYTNAAVRMESPPLRAEFIEKSTQNTAEQKPPLLSRNSKAFMLRQDSVPVFQNSRSGSRTERSIPVLHGMSVSPQIQVNSAVTGDAQGYRIPATVQGSDGGGSYSLIASPSTFYGGDGSYRLVSLPPQNISADVGASFNPSSQRRGESYVSHPSTIPRHSGSASFNLVTPPNSALNTLGRSDGMERSRISDQPYLVPETFDTRTYPPPGFDLRDRRWSVSQRAPDLVLSSTPGRLQRSPATAQSTWELAPVSRTSSDSSGTVFPVLPSKPNLLPPVAGSVAGRARGNMPGIFALLDKTFTDKVMQWQNSRQTSGSLEESATYKLVREMDEERG